MEQRLGIDSSVGLEQLKADRACSQPLIFQRASGKAALAGRCGCCIPAACYLWDQGSLRAAVPGVVKNTEEGWERGKPSLQQLDRSCSEAVTALLGNDS